MGAADWKRGLNRSMLGPGNSFFVRFAETISKVKAGSLTLCQLKKVPNRIFRKRLNCIGIIP